MTNKDLPRVYVLDLACDGCEAAENVVAPNRSAALTEAVNIGWWRERHGRLLCPNCATHPLVRS